MSIGGAEVISYTIIYDETKIKSKISSIAYKKYIDKRCNGGLENK